MIVSRDYTTFRALRWGRQIPGAVLWFACAPNRQVIVIDELKFQNADPSEVVAMIRAKDDDLRMNQPCRYTAAEPLLWKSDIPHGPTVAEGFALAGMPLIQSSGERVQGWNQVASALKQTVLDTSRGVDQTETLPLLVIAATCRQLIRTLPLLREGDTVKEDIDQKKGVDACLVEALRIGMMSRPSASSVNAKEPATGSMGHALAQAREAALSSDY